MPADISLITAADRARATAAGERAARAAKVWGHIARASILGNEGTRLAALVENLVAMIQGTVAPSEWREVADATVTELRRRCEAPSATGIVLAELRPEVRAMGRAFRPAMLGTDAVGRGAGWFKTQNTINVAEACHDAVAVHGLSGGEIARAMKDIIVCAVQGCSPGEWKRIAREIGRHVETRMVVR